MLNYYEQKIEDGLIDAPEETPEILEEQRQIWEFMPVIRSVASGLQNYSNISYLDLCQQGYLILAEMADKVDWQMSKQSIASFVKTKAAGKLRDYVAQHSKAVRIPHFKDYYTVQMDSIDSQSINLLGDEPNPEEQLLLTEHLHMLRSTVAVILPSLNEREFYVLFNCMLTDSPLPVREVADQFDCDKSSIHRDIVRLKTRLRVHLEKELYEDSKT